MGKSRAQLLLLRRIFYGIIILLCLQPRVYYTLASADMVAYLCIFVILYRCMCVCEIITLTTISSTTWGGACSREQWRNRQALRGQPRCRRKYRQYCRLPANPVGHPNTGVEQLSLSWLEVERLKIREIITMM
jgi:hypothetical protein